MKKIFSWVLTLVLMLTMVGALANDNVLTTDVVVVGGGGAGISAALAASQQGAKVILLEKVGYLGGATLMSGGIVPAVGTKQQIEAGIDDSVEWFIRDMMRPSNYSVRGDLVRTVAEQAKGVIEWMESMGVTFNIITNALYYGQSNYRMHLADGSGKGMTEALINHLTQDGNITVLLNTPGTGLVTNGANEVIGVTAQGKDGEMTILANNVVLATSGFAANKEMVNKYIPEVANAQPFYAAGATGEGILWGQQLGAAVANMGSYQGHAFYGVGYGTVDQGIANRGGILVNTNGVRFCNEYGGYSELTPHVLAQPGGVAWLVFDDVNAQNTTRLPQFTEAGIVKTGATAAELAAAIEVNPAVLEATVTAYQASIERGEDEFNRTKLPATFNGPYYAIQITGDLRHTQGGLVTDTNARVLREDGSLIPGLYAAGGVTEGFSSEGGAAYMSGNGLLQALIFGKIAGENAATEVRGQVVQDAPPASAETATESPAEQPATAYKDGEYTGTAKGYLADITVKVVVAEGVITSVEVTEQADTPAIYASAEEALLPAIVAQNGIGELKADSVTGATGSARGILDAIAAALEQAK